MNNHAHARDTQSQFENIVMEVFGGTIAVIGLGFETMVALATGV